MSPYSNYYPCSIEGCTNPHLAKGLCRKHYLRMWKHGDVTVVKKGHPPVKAAGCSVADCDRPHCARGFCQMHLRRVKEHGTPDDPRLTRTWSRGPENGNFRHGGNANPAYVSWRGMIQRCINPTNRHWKYYGGRGITVCERWRTFENFLADMGERPAGKSVDRRNNDGNYEPANCRWATREQQRANQRRPGVESP